MFKFGADPEIFLTANGKPAAAFGVIPGTKKKPHACKRGAYQVDGMAVEFNIEPTDQYDFMGFNANIVTVMKELETAVKTTNPDLRFKIEPVQEFSQELLDSLPDEAKVLGCDPDYNAYTMKVNPEPDGTRLFRTAAGHIHIGWGSDIPVDNEEHFEICADFVRDLDATVGLFMTFIDRDPRRRELYGRAGAFRPKSYGVEYRTPSNVWLKKKSFRQLVHTLLNTAISMKQSGRGWATLFKDIYDIQKIIDYGDFELAEKVISGNFFKWDHNWETCRKAVNTHYKKMATKKEAA